MGGSRVDNLCYGVAVRDYRFSKKSHFERYGKKQMMEKKLKETRSKAPIKGGGRGDQKKRT